jgi:hypothetical protein
MLTHSLLSLTHGYQDFQKAKYSGSEIIVKTNPKLYNGKTQEEVGWGEVLSFCGGLLLRHSWCGQLSALWKAEEP